MKENFKEKIKVKLNEMVASNDEGAFEAIADVFAKEFMKDERTLADIGRSLCKAFLHNDVDEALVAACGYSMYGIMDLANVIPPEEEKKENIAEEFEALSDNLYREALAKNIAIYLFEDGTCNTTSGNWITYFDEIEERFQVILSDNRDFCNQIVVELMKMYGEKIAEISVTDEAFDIIYYLDFCPNAEVEEGDSLNNDCGGEKQVGEFTPSAELIAKFIVETGLGNTTTGKWLILYDAIDDAFGIWLPHNKALLAEVLQRLKEDYSEVVAEVDVETWELGIAVYYYTDRCPNVVVSKMETPTEERKN